MVEVAAQEIPQDPQRAAEREIRLAIARKFFTDGDVPPHLLQSWEAYDSYRYAREQVGDPLPPGGCIVLGYASVVNACLAEMHMNLCKLLKLPPAAVVVRLDRSSGRPVPVADITDPTDLLVVAKPGQSPKDAVKETVERAVHQAQEYFAITVKERLFWCEARRQDLDQPVAPPTDTNG